MSNTSRSVLASWKTIGITRSSRTQRIMRILHSAVFMRHYTSFSDTYYAWSPTPPNEPIWIYYSTKGKYKSRHCYITNDQVLAYLRGVASVVYKIKPNNKSLKVWSPHSIRVTACNILHRQGTPDSYIKIRLRWKSNTFLDYLGNTLHNASKHTKKIRRPSISQPTMFQPFPPITSPYPIWTGPPSCKQIPNLATSWTVTGGWKASD